MIRVLHVIGGMGQGGAENFLMNLYRNIDRNKIQFDFLVNREGIFDEEIQNLGGKIYYIPALQKVGTFRYIKNLDEFFKKHKEYIIVHSHINKVTGLILERANKANIPVRIAHSHGSKDSKNMLIRIFKKPLGNKILDNATMLIGCSDKACEWLFKENSNKAIILNNGIEVNKFKLDIEIRKKVRQEIGVKKEEIIVGHVGRFVFPKNHKYLIDIFKEYKKLNNNSKLLLVGDGPLRKKIEEKIKVCKLEKDVIMLGNRNDVNKIYQAMDLFVFPSINEGLPLSVIEAQVSGLQVFASDNITKMINVTNNVKFLKIDENPKIWAEEMMKVNIENRSDESETVKNAGFDIKDIALKYMDLLERD